MKNMLFLCFFLISMIGCNKDEISSKVYLFAYFKSTGATGLHLAYSRDGYQWTALNDGQSFLKPEVGTGRSTKIRPVADTVKIMRDPCIIQAQDGTFHMVWTAGWEELGIGYASSEDLVHWSTQKYIPVMEHEPDALNCWAPEIIYDEEEDQYLIFWATTIPGCFPDTENDGDRFNNRIYYLTTKDFESFSETRLFYDPGCDVIDATINMEGEEYMMFIKMTGDTSAIPNIMMTRSPGIYGPYEVPGSPITSGEFSCEGPTSIKIDGTRFVYFDKYIEGKIGAAVSKNLIDWNDISELVEFPEGASHGTVFMGDEDLLIKLQKE